MATGGSCDCKRKGKIIDKGIYAENGLSFKGPVCKIQGALLTEMEYNHNYVFISV